MPCEGHIGDYLCAGWRLRAASIRERDGNRCRGCNRGEPDVSLEVHHRTYGTPGQCGECYLTSVSDDDLITLCAGVDGCHEAITNVRRAARYAAQTISVDLVVTSQIHQQPIRIKTEIPLELATARVPAGTVVRAKPFNPQDED